MLGLLQSWRGGFTFSWLQRLAKEQTSWGACCSLGHRGVAWHLAMSAACSCCIADLVFAPLSWTQAARLACRFGKFLGITVLESFAASAMGLSVGSIAPTGHLHAPLFADT